MKILLPIASFSLGVAIASSASSASSASAAQQKPQPPMNDFNYAYYICDAGGAFQMNYPSKTPDTAKLVTSNNSKAYQMKRSSGRDGVSFVGEGATFTTDGDVVAVTGTEVSLQNCKRSG